MLALRSDAFADGGAMPPRHAGAGVGDDLSPPLAWDGVPPGTAELVLAMQDPDVPLRRPAVHLIAFGIDPSLRGLPEGALSPPGDGRLRFGTGFLGRIGYAGPRPMRGHGPHRYVFQLFALAAPLTFDAPPGLAALAAAMRGKMLARGRLTGVYERD